MRLVANWRAVLKHAASVKLIVLAALLSGIEAALPFIEGWLPIRPGAMAIVTFFVAGAALVARFIAQKSVIDPHTKPGDPE